MKHTDWPGLPDRWKSRLAPLRAVVEALFRGGLVVDVLEGDTTDVREAGYLWGGPAVYQRGIRTLAMTDEIAYGTDPAYGTYRGDVHELGHAVWFLLLTTQERYLALYPMWKARRAAGRLLDHYSATSAEEWFAQAFEAFWTRAGGGGIDWNREDLKRIDRELHVWLAGRLRALGADVDRTI